MDRVIFGIHRDHHHQSENKGMDKAHRDIIIIKTKEKDVKLEQFVEYMEHEKELDIIKIRDVLNNTVE